MTVKYLKEILEKYDDFARVILDNGCFRPTASNEVVDAIQVRVDKESKARPVVILQTREDFDVEEELEARFDKYLKEDWDEADALDHLFALGYTLKDFSYDKDRYEWACRTAREHGLI